MNVICPTIAFQAGGDLPVVIYYLDPGEVTFGFTSSQAVDGFYPKMNRGPI
jgi:hypothetical protein